MNIEFVFIGWNTEGTSDKIWGYFLTALDNQEPRITKQWGHSCCIFWAARGKGGTLHFKSGWTGPDLESLTANKRKKGYKAINNAKLHEIWPGFAEEFSQSLLCQKLAGKVR